MKAKRRPIILIDFDGTIAASQKAAFDLYQEDTGDYSRQYTNEHKWNFEGLIPQEYQKKAINYFSDQRFFDILEPNDSAIEVIKDLSVNFDIIIVTKHDPDGVPMKAQWIRNNLPFVRRVVFLNQNDMNKGHIIGDIIIDDNIDCLESSLAPFKICFGDYGYNEDYEGIRAYDWYDVGCILFNFYDNDNIIKSTYEWNRYGTK